MKQEIKPATIAIAIVIVVILVAIIGFKVFGPSSSADGNAMRQKYMPHGLPTGDSLPNSNHPPAGVSTGHYGSSGYGSSSPPPNSNNPPPGG